MKNLFTTGTICLLAALTFTSCNDKGDDMDEYYKELERQELRTDSILNAQKIDIEEYVVNHEADHEVEAQEDSIYYRYNYINKETKRGIWYWVDSEPTDDSYEYGMTAAGVKYPKGKLNYRATLLDGTVVEEKTNMDFDLGTQSPVINYAWLYSFFPYSVSFNGEDRIVEGLTENGLKVGSKITVVTPSVFAYGSIKKTGGVSDIPADSPLVYEFEILEIE